MTNKIRHALAAALALLALGGPLALVATADSANAQPAAQTVRTYDLVATSTPAPAVEETVIVLPETKIYGTRPQARVAAKPAKKPCEARNEGTRPLLSDYQGTVRSFSFCN